MSTQKPSSASKLVVDASVSHLLAYDLVQQKIPKIFIRVTPLLKKRWMKMCESRGVKQQVAGTRVFEWLVKQDQAIQQAILNGGKTVVVRDGRNVTLTIDSEESNGSPEARGVEPLESPAR